MKKLVLITAGILVTVGILITVAVLALAPLRPGAPVELLLAPMPSPMSPVRTVDVHGTGVLLPRAEAGMIAHLTGVAGPAGRQGVLPSPAQERMIVRTGEMGLVVEDVVDARDEIAELVVRFDGYVVSSWILGEERGWITIRVPDERFEHALAELRDLAVRVTSESTTSRDVTEEYIDLKSRLRNAEATEKQFLALLERAEDVADIVSIYDGLFRVRGEIERIKGRMLYLERTVSMSLISVHLEPAAIPGPLVRPGWSPVETLKSAIRGIVIFGQLFATTVIWLIIFSPVWGTALGIIYYWRRHRRKLSAS